MAKSVNMMRSWLRRHFLAPCRWDSNEALQWTLYAYARRYLRRRT